MATLVDDSDHAEPTRKRRRRRSRVVGEHVAEARPLEEAVPAAVSVLPEPSVTVPHAVVAEIHAPAPEGA